MEWSDDEEMDTIMAPISVMDDKLSKLLHNAKIDMPDVTPSRNTQSDAISDVTKYELKRDIYNANLNHSDVTASHCTDPKTDNFKFVSDDMGKILHNAKANMFNLKPCHNSDRYTNTFNHKVDKDLRKDAIEDDLTKVLHNASLDATDATACHRNAPQKARFEGGGKVCFNDVTEDQTTKVFPRAKLDLSGLTLAHSSDHRTSSHKDSTKDKHEDATKEELSKALYQADLSLADMNPSRGGIPKKVRFKEDMESRCKEDIEIQYTEDMEIQNKDNTEACWVTSPNANTYYPLSQRQGQQSATTSGDKDASESSVPETLANANLEYVSMKNRQEKESVITKSTAIVPPCCKCRETVQDVRLCPHCDTTVCLACIQRYLTGAKPKCPNCKSFLMDQRTLRFGGRRAKSDVDTATHQSSTGCISRTCDGHHECDREDVCSKHKERRTVFCCTCRRCICHKCALWEGVHGGHSFRPVDKEYKEQQDQLHSYATDLRRRHRTILDLVKHVERSKQVLEEKREAGVREIRQSLNTCLARLENTFKTRMISLDGQSSQLRQEWSLWDSVLHKADGGLALPCRSHFLEASADVMALCQQLRHRQLPAFVTTPVPTELTSEVVPPFASCTFTMTSFSVLRQRGDPVYSPPLSLAGIRWRLKVYPDGKGEVKGHFLSVFLQLTAGPQEVSRHQYRLELIQPHKSSTPPSDSPRQTLMREFTSDFAVGECWGYSRFCSLHALLGSYLRHSSSDSLTFRLNVRPPTFFQLCRQLQWHSSRLETSNGRYTQSVKDLKQRLRQEACSNTCEDGNPSAESQPNHETTHFADHEPNEENDKKVGKTHLSSDTADDKDASSPGSSGGDSAIGDVSDMGEGSEDIAEGVEEDGGGKGHNVTSSMNQDVAEVTQGQL